MHVTIPIGKKHLKLQQRDILIISSILILAIGLVTAELIHHHPNSGVANASHPAENQTYTPAQSTNQNKYAPQLQQIGQVYYDDNHLISYELVSVDRSYVDPKLQNSDYCPESQQLEAQGSHVVQNVSCTITSKLLTWKFTNTTDKTVDVPGAYALYNCMASSSDSDNASGAPAGYMIASEGFDPGPGVNGSMYYVTHTTYPSDPVKTLSPSNILTGTLVDTVYQPGETKIVKSELGHNCTAVGETLLGGSYIGWKI